MWTISRATLRGFWEARSGADAVIARESLDAWFKAVEDARWANWADLKQTFPAADRVGNCVVFDVASNRYRLIGRVMFRSHKVYILAVMDHAEYDRRSWARDCGCHTPPPRRPRKTPAPKRKRG